MWFKDRTWRYGTPNSLKQMNAKKSFQKKVDQRKFMVNISWIVKSCDFPSVRKRTYEGHFTSYGVNLRYDFFNSR